MPTFPPLTTPLLVMAMLLPSISLRWFTLDGLQGAVGGAVTLPVLMLSISLSLVWVMLSLMIVAAIPMSSPST